MTLPPITLPITLPPITPPALAASVTEAEAIEFVTDYYERVRAGEYATTWQSLSGEFRDTRDLTFRRYVSYWRNTTVDVSNLRVVSAPGSGESRVVFDGHYSTPSGDVLETDEITLRRSADGSPVITAQRTV